MFADTGRREVQMFGSRNETAVLDHLLKDFDANQCIHCA